MFPKDPTRSSARGVYGDRSARSGETPPSTEAPERRGPDLAFIIALFALVSVGMVMVYTTTALDSGFGALQKMGKLLLLVGIPGMLVGIFLPLRIWRKLSPILLVLTLIALALLKVLPEPFVKEISGAKRWFFLPGGYQVQPSEFAKLAFVLFAASFLDRRGQRMQGRDWGFFLGLLGLFAGNIYKEPDLGTALVLAGTAFMMLIASGVNWRPLVRIALVGILAIALLAWNTEHQQKRLLAWWNPWNEEYRIDGGWQVTQSWLAMARGGLTGVGLGQSVQKLPYHLPESHTDFIFAIVAEEMGLFRSLAVLWLFGLLAWRGYAIAARAPDRYSSLVVSGVTSWVAVQSGINIAVVTGTVPNTGVPLPFISNGISSLTALLVATGIVIGVSRTVRPGAGQVLSQAKATATR